MSTGEEYEMQYKRLEDAKEKGIDSALRTVGHLKNAAQTGKEVFADQGRKVDTLNNKLDSLGTKARKINNKIENNLNRTSNCINCTLYIILGVELFFFILLMSI